MALRWPLTFRPLLGAQLGQDNKSTGDLWVRPQKSLIPSLQITETRGSLQRSTSTRQGGFFGKKMGLVEETHFLACCFRQHERRPAKSGLGPRPKLGKTARSAHHRGHFGKAGGETGPVTPLAPRISTVAIRLAGLKGS